MRAVDVIRRVAPRARPEYLQAFEQGDALLSKHEINTPLRLAHFLAQCLHETGGLTILWESGAYSAERLVQIFGVGRHSAGITETEAEVLARNGPAIFERVYGLGNPRKARELGNLDHGDGYKYRGGGIMQTTGRANYKRMGLRCGVDFEKRPELVVSAEHALKPALAEWSEGKLNDAADRDDIRAITRRINGGYNGLEDREHWYRRVRPLIDKVDFKIGSAPQPIPDVPMPVPKQSKDSAKKAASSVGGLAVVLAFIAFVREHPIETMAITAALAGGGYYLWRRRQDIRTWIGKKLQRN